MQCNRSARACPAAWGCRKRCAGGVRETLAGLTLKGLATVLAKRVQWDTRMEMTPRCHLIAPDRNIDTPTLRFPLS